MKFNKLVKIILLNSFMLLTLAFTLTSCQEHSFPKTGMFSEWIVPQRGIASVPTKIAPKTALIHQQDMKQILIYCRINSKNPNACFQHEFNALMLSMAKEFPHSSSNEITQIKINNTYKIIKNELDEITQNIMHKINQNLKDVVHNRKRFCEKNSKYFLHKCLNQYLTKDTFFILNKFYQKNKMNGQEYLYLKQVIKKKLSRSLQSAQSSIETKRSST
ncbi:MAG: hypothetical protein HON90_02795 [Halobacteriovoraceae bacterium]|jgi:hypothetical protein|nr:hypothetical protein [Halobacteriovoraceae bacterium]